MRKKTTKMLREYASGIGATFDEMKSWWTKLPDKEKATMSERIQKELERGKKEAKKRAEAQQKPPFVTDANFGPGKTS